MTISKRLKISYILLVVIPFVIFMFASIFIRGDYTERLYHLKLSIQTVEFNKELYGILGNNTENLFNDDVLQNLINLTENPDYILCIITTDEKIVKSVGNKEIPPEDINEQRYINYWLFNMNDGTPATIFFINSYYKLGNFSFALSIPIAFYILLISLLTFITSRKITRPLSRLKDAAIAIKNEDFDFDITYSENDEINDVFIAFNEMRERLKKNAEKQLLYEKNRTELITNISHDLKTPITAIKGYIEGIVDGVANTPEKIKKYHDTIYKKITILDKLIENLFLYSKLDLKTIPFNYQKLNMNLFMSDIIEEIRYDEPKTSISFQSNSENTTVYGDPIQLQRVINNIVGNSIKYSNGQQCEISIEIIKDCDFVTVSIRDNGPGLMIENINDIFERFYRADPARSSSTEGSGLGLAISKQIIQEHNGEIYASKNDEKGITIFFKLPLIKDKE